MKAILISIRPEWVAKILNGEKTIEIRKKFPSDFVGWVYIYCTKARPYLTRGVRGDVYPSCVSSQGIVPHHLNSRVVARFWCDKVEEIECIASDNGFAIERYITKELSVVDIMEKSCLYFEDLKDYLYYSNGYAIHITKLEIFDKPKELSEFKSYKKNIVNTKINGMVFETELDNSLIKAPQSWCYVEVAE